MPTSLQLRRGTTTQHGTFTGAAGEVSVDTTKNTAVVHNGSTAGGFPLARENLSNVPANSVTTTMLADNSVTSAKIAAGAVITVDIADANVTTAKIADANVTSAKLASGAARANLGLTTWNITESGGVLYFSVSGVNKAKLDASGNLTVTGNVTAYGTV